MLVSTSYKVMFSSLIACDLEEIGDARLASLLETGRFRHVMAVRDPYARLASFFSDKLRHDLRRSAGEWQYCQRIFFPLVGVDASDSFTEVREALLGISFDEFIDFLPQVREDHLTPQGALLTAKNLDLSPVTSIFRIEVEASGFWDLVGVKDPPHANRTPSSADPLTLSRERLDIVNSIYADDFIRLGYEMR